MGVPSIKSVVSGNFDHNLLTRSHRAVSREANRKAMWFHFHEHIPKHFEPGAGRRYHYPRRISNINLSFLYRTNRSAWEQVPKIHRIKKDRATGEVTRVRTARGFYKDVKHVLGMPPLVWSGETRSMATSSALARVTAVPTRGRLLLRTPNYVTSRLRALVNADHKQIQMQAQALQRSAELEAITPGEILALQRAFRDEYVAITNNPAHPKHHLVVSRTRAVRRKK